MNDLFQGVSLVDFGPLARRLLLTIDVTEPCDHPADFTCNNHGQIIEDNAIMLKWE
jgi:hypothetical protein